ncbi:ATP-binding cassette domain-containing protein [Actinomadura harenae]|uniref:ATP-binding cassette domain-containing protein n=1 Tax=Actinomadura harenae TaxID=2483351 RepID=A0A3M2M169_9ACTN|nr:ATP-binding cassette domain-containing protein [Actinomadura harenae]RMI43182.1 ATP-binding cassette domain-containing protein [Actinomadura harenae]
MEPPADGADLVVYAENLHKRFGKTEALRGLDLAVPRGTVLGVLGPNGSGKTTAVRILATLTRPDSGTARVAGFDVVRQADELRHRIGLTGQHSSVDLKLTGRENMVMFGRLYHLSKSAAEKRAAEVLERFGLAHAADRLVDTYSGGMRRRLDLIASLVFAPSVLFLDEPTTGLDPRSRSEIWDTVRDLVRAGTTVLLTTQYLDEADQLADHVVVIDAGKAIASGTPDRLKEIIGSRLDLVVRDAASLAAATGVLTVIGAGAPETDEPKRTVSIPVNDTSPSLTEILRRLDQEGVAVENIGIRRPTLDEVFLKVTGGASAGSEQMTSGKGAA